VDEAPKHPLERPDKVQTLDPERPCDGDHLEHLGWQVSLPSVVLTPFARAYHLGGVSHDSGPVETLPECVPDEGAWHRMVAVDALMDVLKQLPPLLKGNTALQDSSRALLVEFPI
jgi:hypothetical protein